MSWRARAILGVAILVFGAAGTATADTASSIRLRLEAESLEEPVGGAFRFLVTIENGGTSPISVNELDLDIQSVYFHIVTPNEDFYYHRIHDSITERHEYARVTIPPGESISHSFQIPVFRAGNIEVTAKYNGFAFGAPLADLATSNSVTVTGRPVGNATAVHAIVHTSKGDFTLSFNLAVAPNTALNFMDLVRNGYYSNQIFHRVVRNFVIQGGDPEGTGMGGPGWSILLEGGGQHVAGALGLARSQNPHSGGSQFYVTLRETPQLDRNYCVFGQVVDGMSVVTEIGAVPVGTNDRPTNDVAIAGIELVPAE